jgi:4a-hydroxytetrahydrobiopterin dehydratase
VLSQYYGMIFSDVKPQSVGWIGITGGIFFCIAWLWAGITSLSLFREASRPEPIPPIMLPMMNNEKIQAGLVAVPKWKCDEQIISRTYEFEDFVAAMKFVNAVAALAEQAQHHPDIDVRWNKVTLGLTTHDAGGLLKRISPSHTSAMRNHFVEAGELVSEAMVSVAVTVAGAPPVWCPDRRPTQMPLTP